MILMGGDADSLVQEGLDFPVNYKKGQLTLVHSIIFIGFLIDSQSMTISLTPERIHSVKFKHVKSSPMVNFHFRKATR